MSLMFEPPALFILHIRIDSRSLNVQSAGAALSALIQALKKSKMVAIVRYAFSDKSAPRMGFLSPRIKERYKVGELVLCSLENHVY